jgi:DmsE family decaheme c-type cytochrome
MGGIIRKALNVLLIPPSNRKIAKRARRLRATRKTPVFALAARLFVAGAFVIGQPVIAEPTPDTSVRASDAFAALQDFVQTQRVVSLNLLQPTSGEPTSQARDPYSVLSDFVRVADASGWVPPVQAQGAAPDDAIHAGLRAASGPADHSGLAMTSVPAQGAAPDDAIHAGLRAASGPADHSGLAMTPVPAQGAAPDDAIHAGLRASSAAPAAFAQINDPSGATAPDDAIHAGLKGAAKTGSDDYSALRDYAAGLNDPTPMVVAAASEAPKTKKIDASSSGPAAYVGSQACVKCHRDQFGAFSQTLHGEIFLKHPRNEQEKEGCESCHGPGSNHVRTKETDSGNVGDIISFSKDAVRPVAERNAICLTCHERADRTYWDGSTHETRGLACTSCHQIMEKVSVKFQLLKSTEPEVCFQCHKDVRAKMVNSSHMPLQNGSIVCSSCHNPHGSATDGLLREASVNETCYKCHADKRGPYLWEHEPVRENCLNCHDPHGSVNEYMLTMQRPRLCQSCHMGPGHGNPGNPMTVQSVNRSCQNCHTFVHGSNSPAGELFQR